MTTYVAIVTSQKPGLFIYGPFKDTDAATEFGWAYEEESEGDPRWNVFHTDSAPESFPVMNPEW